ncbi:MAG: hypothetical protein OXO50_00480 [Caldilineaceae bacterium]|nr:hypothetical protein [Caldilineaceae bacterium]
MNEENNHDEQATRNRREAQMLAAALDTAENMQQAAKSLKTIRRWIVFWSVLAIISAILTALIWFGVMVAMVGSFQ